MKAWLNLFEFAKNVSFTTTQEATELLSLVQVEVKTKVINVDKAHRWPSSYSSRIIMPVSMVLLEQRLEK